MENRWALNERGNQRWLKDVASLPIADLPFPVVFPAIDLTHPVHGAAMSPPGHDLPYFADVLDRYRDRRAGAATEWVIHIEGPKLPFSVPPPAVQVVCAAQRTAVALTAGDLLSVVEHDNLAFAGAAGSEPPLPRVTIAGGQI